MRIENQVTQKTINSTSIPSGKEEKTEHVARGVLLSLPTIGFDPMSLTLGAVITALVKTGVVCGTVSLGWMGAKRLWTGVSSFFSDEKPVEKK